ncbi:MAG: cation transporter [Salinivirgaceae bacterium]|nr:cation transporter [Salinivirgaceae bacterium]
MAHNHSYCNNIQDKKLIWVTVLNFSITLVQIAGGLISNSLSLLSDALHNLGDSSAIFIALLAGKRSRKKPDEHRTFGYKRIEVLAALLNTVVLISICIFLFYEAYQRFLEPEPIKGKVMFVMATFGLLANLISVLILNKDKNHSLNIKAAYIHLLGDTLSSIAVILGGIAIWLFDIIWLDPLITTLVGIYIIYHTWGIAKETVDILMQSTPVGIDVNAIKERVEVSDNVDNIHHLHVWKLDDVETHLEAHINLNKNIDMVNMMIIKVSIESLLKEEFGINHITLQMGYDCCQNDSNLIHSNE